MELALIQAKKAYKKGDVPIGAVIVYNNKIIAKAYNQKEKNKNAILHAEILVINKACKKLKTWHLEQCELYTTLEPCMMCMGAIIQSRIGKIYYATDNENNIDIIKKYNKKVYINKGLYEEESKRLIQQFFKERRK